ncbi:hypothetical protein Dsin_023130 [Dipteronia sinensis]|uniref:GDSL esterase/lipase n=1 Tax=Dipteronia sinensis TaxID=43782 RepID=A0AAE0A3D4_9ROSI|nr:hypothetical protein Dsin_023130 [Dipteronia sinensis]
MIPAMFVFGDSLVDVGNNNYLRLSLAKANYPHNGIDFPTKRPTGRFSNGKNSADFLAEKVGLPTSPPYLFLRNKKNKTSLFMNGVSFASAGAGIFNDTNQILGELIPLTKQVDYYETVYEDLMKQLGSGGVKQHLSESLFVVVIGSNDIFYYLGLSVLQNKYTPQQYVTLMTTNLEPQLRRIYKFGARKFVVVGLGQIGCTPLLRVVNQAEECNEEVNNWCVNYNERLKTMLQELKSELQDLSYSYFEAYNFMQNIVQKPATYGLTEIKEACCGIGKLKAMMQCTPFSTYCNNRNEYLFWDFCHLSQAASHIFVDAIFDGPSQYTFPINMNNLVAV